MAVRVALLARSPAVLTTLSLRTAERAARLGPSLALPADQLATEVIALTNGMAVEGPRDDALAGMLPAGGLDAR